MKIVALGHRSGAVIIAGAKSKARNLGDLRGKRIAIPSRFAVNNLFVGARKASDGGKRFLRRT